MRFAAVALGERSPRWQEAPGIAPDASGEVHLWRMAFDPDETTMDAQSIDLLSEDERERAGRFRFDEHRRQFVAGRVFVRTALARYVRADPASLVFSVQRWGKPQLAVPPRIEFSFSRSGNMGLLAVHAERPVGVDLERLREHPEMISVAANYLSHEEVGALQREPTASRAMRFLRSWTRHEAVLKAAGLGLAGWDAPGGADPLCEQFHLFEIDPAEGYVGALALRKS